MVLRGKLSFLTEVDQLLICHKDTIFDSLCKCETKYIFTATASIKKDSKCVCCGYCREYEYVLLDQNKKEFLYLRHPTDFGACLNKIEVFLPRNKYIGAIHQEPTLCTPSFTVRNGEHEIISCIKGPLCSVLACCFSFIQFHILGCNGQKIGRIGRHTTGLERVVRGPSYIAITFPKQLCTNHKALLLAAAVLVNFLYYHNHSTRSPMWIVSVA